MKHRWKTKSQQKAQEGHLEEGTTARRTNGMKNSKPMKKQRKTPTQNSP
jgi:hypothetical protein